MDQQNAPQEKPIPQTLSAFGKEYTLQGVFTDKVELAKVISNWHNAGHGTMVKNANRLYVTQNKTRAF